MENFEPISLIDSEQEKGKDNFARFCGSEEEMMEPYSKGPARNAAIVMGAATRLVNMEKIEKANQSRRKQSVN